MGPTLDCSMTPGMLAVIVVVVVASVVLAYFIGTACVRAWINKSPTYVYCARCNQFLGSLNVGVPPHLVPGFQVPSYNRINHFHDVPHIRVNVSEHDNHPPTGTFQRLGMRTSKSNRSSTFPNFLSPIQASPPDKITTSSEMVALTPIPEAHLYKYVNQPGAILSKSSTPNDPSSTARVGSLKKTQQSSGKADPAGAGGSGRTLYTANTGCVSGDDSVFYQEEEGGDCRHRREVSKMSQVRILASPPPIGASKLHVALISKTPANASKSYRDVESSSCQPQTSGPSKIKNRVRSSLRDKGQARRSVQSEGSGKSRLSLMSRKLKLFSDDRKPRNSRDTQYSPLINQNPTTTEDSCGIRSDFSGEDQTPNRDSISNNGDTRKNALFQKKSPNRLEIVAQEGQVINHIFIEEGNVLKTNSLDYPNELKSNREKTIAGNKIIESEAKKVGKLGSPGNTGNILIPHQLVDINIDGSPPPISSEIPGYDYKAGACSSPESNDVSRINKDERLVEDEMLKDGHVMKNTAPTGEDLGTKPKIRSSSSARKEKAQYLGKRPGFTESDITSQSEDESQSEEDETTYKKNRDNLNSLETPSHTPQYPVQTSKYVTTKRGTPTPSSVPMCTPKFVTVRERNTAPDTSNYPPNSWDSKNSSNLPPNSWDPANQDFIKNKPLDLSAVSGQVNLSMNSCINNLSATAMDNSTPAEGNHTSSPHSSAHHAAFKPQDLSIPGLDASLSLQQQSPNQDGSTRARPAHTESSPPLVQDGRYSRPLNPMREPLPLPDTTQDNPKRQSLTLHSPQINPHGIQGKDTEKLGSNNSPRNLGGKNDMRYRTEMSGNLDHSTGSVSSQNQLLQLNHDSSKGSQDTSRGVSLDSTSTLVPSPSPVNRNSRPQTPVISKSSPSPQHSLIPRPIERNHQTRSMPPVTQWSRVQEHALPPSLPPLAPKTRIDIVVPSNSAAESSQSPAQNVQESGTHLPNIRTQNVRSMPPAPQWSRVKEHALPPSLPPPAPKTRILGLEVTNNSRGNTKPTPTNTGSNNVNGPPIDIKEHFHPHALLQPHRSLPPAPPGQQPDTLLQQMRSLPSAPPGLQPDALLQQMRSLPPAPTGLQPDALLQQMRSLPPAPPGQQPDALLQQMRSLPPAPPGLQPDALLQQMRSLPPAPTGLQPDALLQQMRSMPPGPQWSRVNDDRDHGMGVVSKGRNVLASDISGKNSRSSSASGVPMSNGNSRLAVSGGPVRSTIPHPSRPQSGTGQPNSQVDSRSRSTTESSHPPSLIWDSYGSDPSFVPRRPEDLEDFTLSSESESDKIMRLRKHMVYRSDGESVQNRDIQRQNKAVEENKDNQISSDFENLNSKYFEAGVRTRSQSR